jgi:sulfur-oxidizing protein SoxA
MAALVGFGALASVCGAAVASPEQDRQKLIALYKEKFPNVKIEEYVHGAMIVSPDALQQYESIMAFPPFLDDLDRGKKLWEASLRDGKTYADCFPNGGKMVAGNFPYFDEKLGKVVTFEGAVNLCREASGEKPYDYGDRKTMGLLVAYARTLSDGMKMDVKVASPAALAKYEEGKKYYFSRHGQLNFACATCHIGNAGNTLRTEILSPMLGQASHWPVFRSGDSLNTLHMRYRRCEEQVRAEPKEAGSEDYNNLEYFMSYMSNGLPMYSSIYRK